MTQTAVDHTHRYVAMRCIAFCAAYVDNNVHPDRKMVINTDELIAAACKHFGITGHDFQETYEMREGYVEASRA